MLFAFFIEEAKNKNYELKKKIVKAICKCIYHIKTSIFLLQSEEECLESICWESASPIWEKLNELGDQPIPTSKEVDIPSVMGGDMSGITPHKLLTNGQVKNGNFVFYILLLVYCSLIIFLI